MTDDEAQRVKWPRQGDVLFKWDEDVWHNACLNWFHDSLSAYAIGYQDAAEILIRHVLTTRQYKDFLIYPVVFIYRQYVELRLKEIVTVGRRLLSLPEGRPTGHDIEKLWSEARSVIEQVWPDGPEVDLNSAEDYVKQFVAVDPSSTAFRYPTDLNGNASVPGITHINIRNFGETMKRLGNLLDGASDGINAAWDNISSEFGP